MRAVFWPGVWLFGFGCSGDRGPADPIPASEVRESAETGGVASTPADTSGTGDTGGPALDTALPVSVGVSAGPSSHEIHLHVDAPAAVAVVGVCSSADGDLFPIELAPAAVHDLALYGLLASTRYDCALDVDGAPFVVSVDTLGPVAGLPTFTATGSADGAYTLMNGWIAGTGGASQQLILVDELGRRRWHWEPDESVGVGLESARFDATTFVVAGGMGLEPRLVDLSGVVLYQGAAPPGGGQHHHDVARHPSGALIGLATFDTVAPNGVVFEGFEIEATDPATGAVVWQWDSQAATDAGDLPPGTFAHHDIWHANGVQYLVDDEGPAYYVSLAHVDRIIRIDEATKLITWQLGLGLDFALLEADGTPATDDSRWFFGQHDPEPLGNRIAIHDNGRFRPDGSLVTRVLLLELDVPAKTARLVWEYTEPGWYEQIWGGIDHLPSGRFLVTRGHNGAGGAADPLERSAIFELDPNTLTITHQIEATAGTDAIYRADRVGGCDMFGNARYCAALAP